MNLLKVCLAAKLVTGHTEFFLVKSNAANIREFISFVNLKKAKTHVGSISRQC